MTLFPQYRPSERNAHRHVLATQKLGLVPLFMALLLAVATRGGPGPGLWSALGIGAGLHLILWGAHGLIHTLERKSPVGNSLARNADAWFPLFLFSIQGAFTLLTVAILWLTMCDLGFPVTLAHHVEVVLLALLALAYRLAHEAALADEAPRYELAAKLARNLIIILATLWIAGTVTSILIPPGESLPKEKIPGFTAMWIAASVVILLCVATFLDRVARARLQKKT
jgi:hypothetical protein